MKIKYEFLTGEVIEVEVPDDLGEVSVELDRDIFNNNRRETRRHSSFECLQEKGFQIADKSADVIPIIENREKYEALFKALYKLLPQQRDLIEKVFFEGKPIVAVAEELGITKQACNRRLKKIYKQLKKFM